MGIFDSLLQKNTPMPTLLPNETVLPNQAEQLIQNGVLPNINVNTILLGNGEKCCFVDKAYLVHTEIIKHRNRKRNGVSIRVARGVTYHTGMSDAAPVEEKKVNYIPGYLYITNRRVIFVSREHGSEEKFADIIAAVPYTNAIGLQFKQKTAEYLLPRPDLAISVIRNIHH